MDNDVLMKILERLSAIETKITELFEYKEDIKNNTKDINDLKHKAKQNEEKINKMQESNTYLKRLVIGGFVTIGTGLIVAFLKGLLGI